MNSYPSQHEETGVPLASALDGAAARGPTRVGAIALGALLVFVVLAPLIAASPAPEEGVAGEGNVFRQLIYLAVFAMALYGAQVTRTPVALVALPVSLFLMLLWCCLSVAWALAPGIAARRLALTLIIVWSVFLLVGTTGYGKAVRLARWVLALTLAANYIAVLAVPSWAIHQAASEADPSIVGAWRGILMQKNFAGVACVLAMLFFVFDAQRIGRLLRLSVVVAAAVFLYHTNSRTSMILAASSVFVVGLYRLYAPYYRWAACLFLGFAALLAGLLAHAYWDVLGAALSRPDALTGRPLIWSALWRYAGDHWLLGSGFGSFWNVGGQDPIASYTRGWVATAIYSGHNGYLDVLVQTGVPGLILAVIAIVLAPLATFVMHQSLDRSRAGLLLACIWFCIGHNLTESSLFDRDATVHVFLMRSIALLRREAQ